MLAAFGTVAHNAAAASIFGLLSFLIFGLAVGKVLQDVYVRAWRVQVGSLKDQWRFAIWFVISTTLLGLEVSEDALVNTLGRELLVLCERYRLGGGCSPTGSPGRVSLFSGA